MCLFKIDYLKGKDANHATMELITGHKKKGAIVNYSSCRKTKFLLWKLYFKPLAFDVLKGIVNALKYCPVSLSIQIIQKLWNSDISNSNKATL